MYDEDEAGGPNRALPRLRLRTRRPPTQSLVARTPRTRARETTDPLHRPPRPPLDPIGTTLRRIFETIPEIARAPRFRPPLSPIYEDDNIPIPAFIGVSRPRFSGPRRQEARRPPERAIPALLWQPSQRQRHRQRPRGNRQDLDENEDLDPSQSFHIFDPSRPLRGSSSFFRGPRDPSHHSVPEPSAHDVIRFRDQIARRTPYSQHPPSLMPAQPSVPWLPRHPSQPSTVHKRIALSRQQVGWTEEGEPIWSGEIFASLQPRDLQQDLQEFDRQVGQEDVGIGENGEPVWDEPAWDESLTRFPNPLRANNRRAGARTDATGTPPQQRSPVWANALDGSGPTRMYGAAYMEVQGLEAEAREERRRRATLRLMR
jgi:hypothetical protein